MIDIFASLQKNINFLPLETMSRPQIIAMIQKRFESIADLHRSFRNDTQSLSKDLALNYQKIGSVDQWNEVSINNPAYSTADDIVLASKIKKNRVPSWLSCIHQLNLTLTILMLILQIYPSAL